MAATAATEATKATEGRVFQAAGISTFFRLRNPDQPPTGCRRGCAAAHLHKVGRLSTFVAHADGRSSRSSLPLYIENEWQLVAQVTFGVSARLSCFHRLMENSLFHYSALFSIYTRLFFSAPNHGCIMV